jgi:hypothetical protein
MAAPRTIEVMIWNLIGKAERSWRHFINTRPGDRFQVRYYRRQQSAPGRLSMLFNLVAGGVLVIFSTFFGWAPGPGLLTFLLGLALIGGEFLPVARFLDWAEVRLRKLAHFVAVLWRTSVAGKALIIMTIVVCGAALGYGVYRVFFA